MKIAFVADAFLLDPSTGVNGTQVQLYELASAFARRGCQIHYLCTTGHEQAAVDGRGDLQMHFYRRRHGPLRWLGEIGEVERLLRHIRPDALYQRGRSHLTYIAARWAARNGRPFVWGSNGEDSAEFFKFLKRLRISDRSRAARLALVPDMWLRDLAVHRGIRGATDVIAQTKKQAERLKANYGKDAQVLASYYLPPDDTAAASRERMVLWLANLGPGKQPELFLDAVSAMQDVPGWRFVLGGGTDKADVLKRLEAKAATIPSLALNGPVPYADTGKLFARAALFVNTSRLDSEGLPNAFVQAWLHGTPVLSLNHDPNGWIQEHGLGFCAHGDESLFRAKMRDFLEDSSAIDRMRSACHAFARATFADQAVIDAYLERFQRA